MTTWESSRLPSRARCNSPTSDNSADLNLCALPERITTNMAGSPFNKKDGAAVAAAPAAKAAPAKAAPAARAKADPASLPDATPMGSDTPIAPKGASPFDAPAAPAGIAGYKPLHFLDQLVLMHTSEHGAMKTAYSTPEKPLQEFVKVDIIPMTRPVSLHTML